MVLPIMTANTLNNNIPKKLIMSSPKDKMEFSLFTQAESNKTSSMMANSFSSLTR